jgi:hypothetical protein
MRKSPLWIFPDYINNKNHSKGVIAYRLITGNDSHNITNEGRVAVDAGSDYPVISYRICLYRMNQKGPAALWPGWAFVTSVNPCDARRYEMRVHVDFKSCDYSRLIIENGFVCLGLEEMGTDLEGKFAKEVIKEISDEFKQYTVMK